MINMGNKGKKKSKKFKTRKIRIRLADPNIPDSYVCEIFDSSLENEVEPVFDDYSETSKNESSPPKNCFDILMSKQSRKCFSVSSAKENDDISVNPKLLRITKSEESVKNRKLKNQKNNTQLGNSKKENDNCDIESSDDESLFEVQRKFKLHESFLRKDKNEEQSKLNVLQVQNEETSPVFNLPKVMFASKKKSVNILNYFTKVESNSKNKEESEDLENDDSHKAIGLKNDIRKDSGKKLSLDEQKQTLNGVNKENVKLAPLFQKKEKTFNDVASKKARLEFLYRTKPTIKKKLETKKIFENIFNFPTISHIQQRSESVWWSVRSISLSFPVLGSCEKYTFPSDRKFRININQSNPVLDTIISKQMETTKNCVGDIECKYVDFNLESVIAGLKEKQKKYENLTKELDKKCSNDDSNFEVLNTLWTDKYKPKSSEILGNNIVVNKLRKWLQLWKTFDEELKFLFGRKSKNKEEEEKEDLSDVFLSSDDENYGLKAPGNVCFLSGPTGCGKTALIHALANELEFSVVELNASSKRTGKKVLSELQEATQSHKVHRVNLLQVQTLQKEPKKKKNRKHKKKNKAEEPIKVCNQANDYKISLILIEDADIVFEEHDEGYFSAISFLVQTSKRPIVFITNDVNCSYLEGLKNNHCLVLEMERPNFNKSCAVLDAVATLEGGHFQKAAFQLLVCQNHFDLRKSLLQLQFWNLSDEIYSNLSQPFDLGSFWWGLPQFLYRKEVKRVLKFTNRKRKRVNDFFSSLKDEEIAAKKLKLNLKDLISSVSGNPETVAIKSDPMIRFYSDILDVGSVLDAFRLSNNREPTLWFEYKPNDSLSLDENMEETSWLWSNFTENISHEIVNISTRVFAEKCKEPEKRKICFGFPSWGEIRWRKSQEEAEKELAVLVPMHSRRDSRSVYLDYLPITRNICRAERTRSTLNPKRKNRFNHYLTNLGVTLTDKNLEINCNVLHR